MKRKEKKSVNLLDLTPSKLVPWESGENGAVVVLLPKFRNQFLAKWLVPRLKHPDIRIKLDRMGSFVWKLCDGNTTVSEIAERMVAEFGDSATAAHERIRTFLLSLEKSDLVNLYNHGKSVQTD
jgi:hypothetical protein